MFKGEIWLINLDPAFGAEIQKTRPGVIISENALGILPLKVIVPITEWKERYAIAPWMVCITPDESNGLSKLSAADAFQVRSLSQERLVRKIGFMSDEQIKQILKAVCRVVGG